MKNFATKTHSKVSKLIDKGVKIPNPACIEIGDKVNINLISADNVTIHTGCKIFGSKTLIMSGVTLGSRGPVTINNCQIGMNVELKGGYFERTTFLNNVSMGSGAEIREGCLLEEESNGAHTVGLKQTILFPFVTLGSLVNFCDILMAGGTSRSNHSEVGSSYIHFNYTPNQDKATASLVGDVPNGVMLNQPPIFLGGQGGMVGPCQIGFNSVVAAGVIYRGDSPNGNKFLMGKTLDKNDRNFYPGIYWSVFKRVVNSIEYFGNILALQQWYIEVRQKFFITEMEKLLYLSAIEKIKLILNERTKRFKDLAEKMGKSIELYKKTMKEEISESLLKQKIELSENIQEIEKGFNDCRLYKGNEAKKDAFLKRIDTKIQELGNDYIKVIQNLNDDDIKIGVSWLQSIIDNTRENVMKFLPSYIS